MALASLVLAVSANFTGRTQTFKRPSQAWALHSQTFPTTRTIPVDNHLQQGLVCPANEPRVISINNGHAVPKPRVSPTPDDLFPCWRPILLFRNSIFPPRNVLASHSIAFEQHVHRPHDVLDRCYQPFERSCRLCNPSRPLYAPPPAHKCSPAIPIVQFTRITTFNVF